eukprot:1243038-Pyramimonas_sp.AAC.1
MVTGPWLKREGEGGFSHRPTLKGLCGGPTRALLEPRAPLEPQVIPTRAPRPSRGGIGGGDPR